MSHVASCSFVVKDLNILEKVCKARGLVLHREQKTHKWYGSWQNDYNAKDAAFKFGIKPEQYGHCEHAIGIDKKNKNYNANHYEIGLYKNPKGEGWLLALDFWAGGHGMVAAAGGNLADGLIQDYSVEATRQEAQALVEAGFTEKMVTEENGDIILTYES